MYGEGSGEAAVIVRCAFMDYVDADHVVCDIQGCAYAEHAGHNDTHSPVPARVILDLYPLGFHGVGHSRLLGQEEDGAANGQAAGGFVCNDGAVLGVEAVGGGHIFLHIGGVENLLPILYQVELPVGRFAILLQLEGTAGTQHLRSASPPEGAAPQCVQRAFGRGAEGVRIPGPVAQQQIHRVVGAHRIGFQVQQQLPLFVELSRAGQYPAADGQNFRRHVLRDSLLSGFCPVADIVPGFQPKQLVSGKPGEIGRRGRAVHEPGAQRRFIGQARKPQGRFPVAGEELRVQPAGLLPKGFGDTLTSRHGLRPGVFCGKMQIKSLLFGYFG